MDAAENFDPVLEGQGLRLIHGPEPISVGI